MTEEKDYGPQAKALDTLSTDIHAINVEKGFYENPERQTVSHRMMLVVTELAEVTEADRLGTNDKPSDKIPLFTNEEEEVADAIIRLLDFAAYRKLRIGPATMAKIAYNRTRPYKHGKKY